MRKIVDFRNLRHLSLMIIFLGLILSMFKVKLWNEPKGLTAIENDVVHYYSYLPALFVHGDLSFKFTEGRGEKIAAEQPFWPKKIENGRYTQKMSTGMSIAYSPFFLLAHAYASMSDKYEANGFTEPYQIMLCLSSIFFTMMGLFFLQKILKDFFSDQVIAITLLLIVFGTNLFYYSIVEPTMTHAYSFGLSCLFYYHAYSWFKNKSFKHILFAGLSFGLIVLIRPVNILMALPLLGLVFYFKGKQTLLQWLKENYLSILMLGLFAFVAWIPQFLYWKIYTGSWMYYSYGEEKFYFLQPHIFDGLFSFRKGWLIYTPLMLFSLLGIIALWKKKHPFALGITMYLPVHVYVIFSWWCWWYAGGFGARPMIETYGLLAIPLAALIQHVYSYKKAIYNLALFGALFALIGLNLFQTHQKKQGIIHWDSMTKEAYFNNFLMYRNYGDFEHLLQTPDYENALKGLPERH